MNEYSYFKPTPLYKEFIILDLIEKEIKITQRRMSNHLGVSVSMINSYLNEYEKNKYIKRGYISSKNVSYNITKSGKERKKILNIGFLKSSRQIYDLAKNNINTFIENILNKGYKRILLYGAGEVAEILLDVINIKDEYLIDVLALIDDDTQKSNLKIAGINIINLKDIQNYEFDGILISSYTNRLIMKANLKSIGYDENLIIDFFND